MKKATANYNTLAFIVFIAFAFLFLYPINTYSSTQNTTEMKYEMQYLENILGQIDNKIIDELYKKYLILDNFREMSL